MKREKTQGPNPTRSFFTRPFQPWAKRGRNQPVLASFSFRLSTLFCQARKKKRAKKTPHNLCHFHFTSRTHRRGRTPFGTQDRFLRDETRLTSLPPFPLSITAVFPLASQNQAKRRMEGK